MTRSSGFLWLLLLWAVACTPQGQRDIPGDQEEPPKVESAPKARAPSSSYWELVEEVDRQLKPSIDFAASRPESWLAQVAVAQHFARRGRLKGSYDDYAQAQAYMDRAFAVPGCAAFAARAKLNLSLHKVGLAKEDILRLEKASPPDDNARSALEDLKGELAFQTGDYAGAKAHYEAAHRIRPRPESWARLGVYRWKMGDLKGALGAFEEAEAGVTPSGDPMFLAWLHLQRGLMDLDLERYDAALEHYRLGDSILPGWWLIEEHIAEILTLQGKTDEALEAYLALIQETQNPEFMDAAAEILLGMGRRGQGEALIARSRRRYESRLEAFPEATWGHALDHYLAFDASKVEALKLAEANAALRPSAPAHIQLAKARRGAGDLKGAREAIDLALATPWQSLELFDLGAEIYGEMGESPRAAELKSKAQELRADQ